MPRPVFITPADIEAVIAKEFTFTADKAITEDCPPELAHITIHIILLSNGMKMVGVNEGSAHPSTFDAEVGKRMARQHAINQIYPLLVYELRTHLFGGRLIAYSNDSKVVLG
jgi:Phage protein (N4 Gp49/phage Sf6 gene 66) family